jgi:hypothetical protein
MYWFFGNVEIWSFLITTWKTQKISKFKKKIKFKRKKNSHNFFNIFSIESLTSLFCEFEKEIKQFYNVKFVIEIWTNFKRNFGFNLEFLCLKFQFKSSLNFGGDSPWFSKRRSCLPQAPQSELNPDNSKTRANQKSLITGGLTTFFRPSDWSTSRIKTKCKFNCSKKQVIKKYSKKSEKSKNLQNFIN